MTNKNFIIRYIILKIILGEYKINELIPSENKLASYLKVTRLYIHYVYSKLTENSILYSKKKIGYFVSPNAMQSIYLPFNIVNNYRISFINTYKFNNKYECVFKIIDSNNDNVGYIITIFSKLIQSINKCTKFIDLLIAYVLNTNFDWDKINNFFENNYDFMFNKQNLKVNYFYSEFSNFKNNNSLVIKTYLSPKIKLDFKFRLDVD